MARKTYTLKFRARLFITGIILVYFLVLFFQQSFEIHDQQSAMTELQQTIADVQQENEVLSRQRWRDHFYRKK